MIIAQLSQIHGTAAMNFPILIGENCRDRDSDLPRPTMLDPGCWFLVRDPDHGIDFFTTITEGGHLMRATAMGTDYVIGMRYATWTGIPALAPFWNEDGSFEPGT